MTVVTLRIAIGGEDAKPVVANVAKIDRADALDAQLHEASVVLRRVRESWQCGGIVGGPPGDAVDAPASDRSDEVALVTLAVASSDATPTPAVASADDLERALKELCSRPASGLVRVELSAQLTSRAAVLARFPPPALVELGTSMAGKRLCAFCHKPFAAELTTCPSCGAPG